LTIIYLYVNNYFNFQPLIRINNKNASETANITLKGVDNVKIIGHSNTLTGAPEDENSIAEPTKVVPVAGTFAAGKSFSYTFPAYSITLLRVGY
jgi:hypothetical protein